MKCPFLVHIFCGQKLATTSENISLEFEITRRGIALFDRYLALNQKSIATFSFFFGGRQTFTVLDRVGKMPLNETNTDVSRPRQDMAGRQQAQDKNPCQALCNRYATIVFPRKI